MTQTIATIGVYGTTEESFFQALQRFHTTHFVDVRRRRGVRGSDYVYANATRLENKLKELGIEYVHRIDLSPSDDTRKLQLAEDTRKHVAKNERQTLSEEFKKRYEREVLAAFDPEDFLAQFPKDARIVFFCVEQHAQVCHRSLLADRLSKQWKDITPKNSELMRI